MRQGATKSVQVFAKCAYGNQTKLSASGIFLDMTGDHYPHSRNRWLPWLLERGLCDPETAAEYVGLVLGPGRWQPSRHWMNLGVLVIVGNRDSPRSALQLFSVSSFLGFVVSLVRSPTIRLLTPQNVNSAIVSGLSYVGFDFFVFVMHQ